jgi:hypothetical protein
MTDAVYRVVGASYPALATRALAVRGREAGVGVRVLSV